jgi:hypothetical protein
VQTVLPACDEYLPFSQAAHNETPALNFPASHAVQMLLPAPAVIQPVAQAVQAALPFVFVNVPAAHDKHTVAPLPLARLPASHGVHVNAPGCDENFPSVHCPQLERSLAALNSPITHWVHAEPSKLKLPASHSWHEVPCPEGFCRPAGQTAHVPPGGSLEECALHGRLVEQSAPLYPVSQVQAPVPTLPLLHMPCPEQMPPPGHSSHFNEAPVVPLPK